VLTLGNYDQKGPEGLSPVSLKIVTVYTVYYYSITVNILQYLVCKNYYQKYAFSLSKNFGC